MTSLIIDSYAWIEYLLSTAKGLEVKKALDSSGNRIFTHVLSISEIASRIARAGGDHLESIEIIISLSEIVDIDPDVSARAGKLHSTIREQIKDFGLVDAFILLAARDNGAKRLTGDPHFKNMKEAVLI